jgi:hypothetical protein
MASDDDDPWLRPVWADSGEDEAGSEGGAPKHPPTSGAWRGAGPQGGARDNRTTTSSASLLLPLTRAQDVVARLEASLEAASPDVRQGLCARLSLLEAAGWLALRHAASPVHPRDLALREAGLTGSYTLAALTGHAGREMPHTQAAIAGDNGPALGAVPQDWAVTQALHYARFWRRLAVTVTWRPLRDPAGLGESLGRLGATGLDTAALAAWCTPLRRAARDRPGLIAAAEAMAGGLPVQGRARQGRGECLDLACGFVAACLWRDLGYGVPVSLPFWSAPLSRLETVARAGGDAAVLPAYLECVAEAALRARRELARLQAAERRTAALAGTARSRLREAAGYALREPVVTGAGLVKAVGVAPRSALDLINRLVAAGVLEESTGRAAWRAYALAG